MTTRKSPEGSHLKLEDVPMDRTGLRPEMKMTWPGGSVWRKFKADSNQKEENDKHLAMNAVLMVVEELKANEQEIRKSGRVNFAKIKAKRRLNIQHSAMAARKKKKTSKAVAGGDEVAPTTTRGCVESERGYEWVSSIENEVGGLTDMGVLQHNYTLKQAREMGIMSKPIPLILAHDFKYGSLGEIDKLKSRACLHGHKGNMQKGVHYWEIFSATPKEDTSRMMQGIMVHLD